MPTTYLSSKAGYIQSYRVILSETPMQDQNYFEVLITDDNGGTQNSETWILSRNKDDLVNNSSTGRWAITFSNVSQAIIATVKDAFLNQKKVLFEGIPYRTAFPRPPEPSKFWLYAVTIYK